MKKITDKMPAAATLAWTVSKVATAGALTVNAALNVRQSIAVDSDDDSSASVYNNVTAAIPAAGVWSNSLLAGIGAVLVIKNGFEAGERLVNNFVKRPVATSGVALGQAKKEASMPNWSIAMAATGGRMALNVGEVVLANDYPTASFMLANGVLIGAALVCGALGASTWDDRRGTAEHSELRGVDPMKLTTFSGAAAANLYVAYSYAKTIPAARALVDLATQETRAPSLAHKVSLYGNTAAAALLGVAFIGVAVGMVTHREEKSKAADVEAQKDI